MLAMLWYYVVMLIMLRCFSGDVHNIAMFSGAVGNVVVFTVCDVQVVMLTVYWCLSGAAVMMW